jgi:hypothetical protein
MSLNLQAENISRATEADWDRYKEDIRQLYLIENKELEGPGGVQDEMKQRHGFDEEYVISSRVLVHELTTLKAHISSRNISRFGDFVRILRKRNGFQLRGRS